METETPVKLIIDCATGESITVPLSVEELAQLKADRLAYETEEAERIVAEEAKEIARESALAKLTALGLTEDEIAAL